VVHFVVYRGLIEDEVALVVPTVLDGVVAGVIELLDGLMDVFFSVVGSREFDRNGPFDLHLRVHVRSSVL
jgi:hypothetical protein